MQMSSKMTLRGWPFLFANAVPCRAVFFLQPISKRVLEEKKLPTYELALKILS